jgi:Tat protein translocase TatB subunit
MVDLLFILALAFLILGPKKLPQLARQLGGFLVQFKKVQNDFKRQLDTEILKVQMDNTTGEAAIAASRTGDEKLPLLADPDPWVTDFRSAKLSPRSFSANGANVTEPSVTSEQTI